MLGGPVPEPLELIARILDEFAAALDALLQFLLSGFDLTKLLISWIGHWIPRQTKSGLKLDQGPSVARFVANARCRAVGDKEKGRWNAFHRPMGYTRVEGQAWQRCCALSGALYWMVSALALTE